MSDTPTPSDSAPKKSRKPSDESTPAPMPEEMLTALGGRPIPVPPMRARRVDASDLHGSPPPSPIAKPTRAANPLFDDPGADELEAAKTLRLVRRAFGQVARHMDEATKLLRHALATDGVTTAAARESFDLEQATKIAAEFDEFLSRHKPTA